MAYSFDQLLQYAQNAGFQGQSAYTAAAIAQAESSGIPSQINWNDPLGSYGLMQINQAAHPGTASEALDPQGSFNLAYQISNGGSNFSPWSTYNSGAYAQYMPATANGVTAVSGYADSGVNPSASFDGQPPVGTQFDPMTGLPVGPGTGLDPNAVGGQPNLFGVPSTPGTAATVNNSWWQTLVNDIGNYMIRGGLIALAIVLIAVAASGFVKGELSHA